MQGKWPPNVWSPPKRAPPNVATTDAELVLERESDGYRRQRIRQPDNQTDRQTHETDRRADRQTQTDGQNDQVTWQ